MPADPALTADVTFRHSGWMPTRARVYTALASCGVPQRRLDAFANCGRHAWIMQSKDDPTRYKIASDHCHDRFCLPCAQIRSRVIAANVLALLPKDNARFITLTLAADKKGLDFALARITRSFSRLRSRALWKRTQKGGVAFIELKLRADQTTWNVHLHVISHGRYIDQRKLSRTWKQITGDSYIVDVRYVRDPRKAGQYVSKYASKPLDPSTTRDPDRLKEAIAALHRVRLVHTYGDWRGEQLTEPPPQGEWIAVAPLAEILDRARDGEPYACSLIDHLRKDPECQTRAPPDPTPALWPNVGPEPCT